MSLINVIKNVVRKINSLNKFLTDKLLKHVLKKIKIAP